VKLGTNVHHANRQPEVLKRFSRSEVKCQGYSEIE